jgi:hypothetical protein
LVLKIDANATRRAGRADTPLEIVFVRWQQRKMSTRSLCGRSGRSPFFQRRFLSQTTRPKQKEMECIICKLDFMCFLLRLIAPFKGVFMKSKPLYVRMPCHLKRFACLNRLPRRVIFLSLNGPHASSRSRAVAWNLLKCARDPGTLKTLFSPPFI